MEDIIELLFKGIARISYFIVRACVWLIFEMFCEIIGWCVGWVVCRTLTVNTFPRERLNEFDKASPLVAISVCAIGVIALILTGAFLAKYAIS